MHLNSFQESLIKLCSLTEKKFVNVHSPHPALMFLFVQMFRNFCLIWSNCPLPIYFSSVRSPYLFLQPHLQWTYSSPIYIPRSLAATLVELVERGESRAICYLYPLVERGENGFVGILEIWKRSLCRVSLCFDTVTLTSSPTFQYGNSGLQIQNWLCKTTRGRCRLICEDSGFWRSEIW